jgi:hypothetical protein
MELTEKIEGLKEQLRNLNRQKDLETKNKKYKTDEEYRLRIKRRNLEYYHNVIKPTKTPIYKKKASQNPQGENPQGEIDR